MSQEQAPLLLLGETKDQSFPQVCVLQVILYCSNRYLMIAFIILKPPNTALILTARDMDRKERKLYERK